MFHILLVLAFLWHFHIDYTTTVVNGVRELPTYVICKMPSRKQRPKATAVLLYCTAPMGDFSIHALRTRHLKLLQFCEFLSYVKQYCCYDFKYLLSVHTVHVHSTVSQFAFSLIK